MAVDVNPVQTRIEVVSAADLVERLRSGAIARTPFARTGSWNVRQRSAYLESLWLGYPVTPLYLVEDDGRPVIVDGLQRATAIHDYILGKFALAGSAELAPYDGMRFQDLPMAMADRLRRTSIVLITATGPSPRNLAAEIFHRLNMTAVPLKEHEFRKLALDGPFYQFVRRCAATEPFRSLVKAPRGRDADEEAVELALRFFAFSERASSFSHEVGPFLDDFIAEMNERLFDEAALLRSFLETMEYVARYFPYGFRRSKADDRIPRVRFEAIAIGVNLALQTGRINRKPDISWLNSDAFRDVVRTEASNSRSRLTKRIEFVRDHLTLQRLD